jgi:hypothetical protein
MNLLPKVDLLEKYKNVVSYSRHVGCLIGAAAHKIPWEGNAF